MMPNTNQYHRLEAQNSYALQIKGVTAIEVTIVNDTETFANEQQMMGNLA